MNRHSRLVACLAPLFILAACQPLPRQQEGAGAPAAPQQTAAAQPARQAPAPKVEFRLAQTAPGKGLQALSVDNQTLHYQPAPVLARDDLASVTPMKTKEGRPFVHLQFNQAGAQKLAQITRQNVGKSLLFTINGQLVGMPRIGGAINDGVLNLSMNSETQAIDVTNAIVGHEAVKPAPADR